MTAAGTGNWKGRSTLMDKAESFTSSARTKSTRKIEHWSKTASMATAEAASVAAEADPGSGDSASCDFCEEARALVYCRADSARLCLACDRQVHAANAVSSKHPRALLCDACLSAPSSVLLCSSSSAPCQRRHPQLLCPNCDFDALHGQSDAGRAGERRPVEPYSGSPAAVEMLDLLGVSGVDEKWLLPCGGGSEGCLDGGGADGSGADEGSLLLLAEEGWVWETPPILSMEDLIVPMNSSHGFPVMGVPPLPKDRNAACGKHKDEILRQLQKLVKSDAHHTDDFGLIEADMGFQYRQGLQQGNMISTVDNDAALVTVPKPQAMVLCKDICNTDSVAAFSSEHELEKSTEESKAYLDRPTDAPVSGSHGNASDVSSCKLMSREDLPLLSQSGHKLSGLDRDSVLSRYKEKRKTRRYDKQIRYESRKVRADGRVRIKGRFAKVNQHAEC